MLLPRPVRILAAALAALLPAAAAHPALSAPLAQQAGGADRMTVIIWTLVAVGVAMLLLAIGYVYRRAAGVDKPPPVTLLEPGQRITGD